VDDAMMTTGFKLHLLVSDVPLLGEFAHYRPDYGIYYSTIDHQRNKDVSLCLLRYLGDITWQNSNFD
jgi:hypothetical protein